MKTLSIFSHFSPTAEILLSPLRILDRDMIASNKCISVIAYVLSMRKSYVTPLEISHMYVSFSDGQIRSLPSLLLFSRHYLKQSFVQIKKRNRIQLFVSRCASDVQAFVRCSFYTQGPYKHLVVPCTWLLKSSPAYRLECTWVAFGSEFVRTCVLACLANISETFQPIVTHLRLQICENIIDFRTASDFQAKSYLINK